MTSAPEQHGLTVIAAVTLIVIFSAIILGLELGPRLSSQTFLAAVGDPSDSEAADAQCNPVITECGCGEVIENGACTKVSQSANMHLCTCQAQTPVGPVLGLCVATDKCEATTLPGAGPLQQPTPAQIAQPTGNIPSDPGQSSISSLSPVSPTDLGPQLPSNQPPYNNNPIFNETTGQWETPPDQPQSANYPTTILPSQNSPTGSVFNETAGQWENLTYSSSCSLLLGTCESAPPETTYPTPELPANSLDSRLQPPGTVLQYTEGAQNYQYAYPNSTFSQPTETPTPPQGASTPPIFNPGNTILSVLQWFSQQFSTLFH